jgi:hypothetical protein
MMKYRRVGMREEKSQTTSKREIIETEEMAGNACNVWSY